MAQFNFNHMEMVLINAVRVAYQDNERFHEDGGYLYSELRSLLLDTVYSRLEKTVKPEKLTETQKLASKTIDEMTMVEAA